MASHSILRLMRTRVAYFSIIGVAACGSSGHPSGVGSQPPGSGGSRSATGGFTSHDPTGGYRASSTGGATSSGGASSVSGGTSDLPQTGGTTSSGGASSASGGASDLPQTGGTTAIGGGQNTGSTQSTGGATNSNGGSASTGGTVANSSTKTCTAGSSNCFSFFITSRARLFALAQAFNGSTKGFGGDLRYGTDDGLTGADKICTAIAESSLPGNGKAWRAFLSTTTTNAIDRVGDGPWYDRLNRLIANNKTELIAERPGGIKSATILNNLPNEDGTPHHDEETNSQGEQADNHDIMTGSDSDGKLCASGDCWRLGSKGGVSIVNSNCEDWTLGTSKPAYSPRVGHSWASVGSDDWLSYLNEDGCAPGYNLIQNSAGTGTGTGTVGGGGGYGAIYCLATNP